MVEVFKIVGRRDFVQVDYQWARDFSLGPAHSTHATIVLEDGWALFSFDFEKSLAIFLDVGAASDLASVPFSYLEQFQLAKRLVAIPFLDFIDIAARISDRKGWVQIFNMGHCGSTLLHNVFNRVPKVWCISEPKFFFDLAMIHFDIEPALLKRLMAASFKFLSLFPGAQAAETLVVKHYSQTNTHIRLAHDAVPSSINLFMYRDGLSWPNSLYGFAQRLAGSKMDIPPEMRPFVWWIMSGNRPASERDGILDLNADDATFDRMAALVWSIHVKDYLRACDGAVPLSCVRYNELTNDRVASIKRILDYCELDSHFAEDTLAAFDTDSHHGTVTSHDIKVEKFTKENDQHVAEIYANPKVNLDPNIRLPNSLV